MSMQYDSFEDPFDQPWIGCCSFPRSDGLNDLALNHWRKARQHREHPETADEYYTQGYSPHFMIVSDAKNNRDYTDRTFVSRSASLRFYCSVPIRDGNGSVLGALCILDDIPRYGVSATQMRFLEDSAETITSQLDTAVARARQQGSERLIKGLGLFNSHRSSLRDWWLGQDNERLRRGGRYQAENDQSDNRQARLDHEFGVQGSHDRTAAALHRARRGGGASEHSPADDAPPHMSQTTETNMNANHARMKQHVSGTDFGPVSQDTETSSSSHTATSAPGDSTGYTTSDNSVRNKDGTSPRNSDMAWNISNAYARASNLICEAMRAEGVVFVDARAASATLKKPPGKAAPSSTDATSSNQSDTGPSSLSDDNFSDHGQSTKLCRISGFATRNSSSLHGSRAFSSRRMALQEAELQSYIRRYRRGKVFNFADAGMIYSSSGEDPSNASSEDNSQRSNSRSPRKTRASRDAARLGKIMDGAQTIAFLPVWDDASDSYSSCVFVWSTTPLRYFDADEDLTYIAAFSHSLTAEIARLEAVASDAAKSTFISSISHELRSPLHGVLAGAELLQDTDLSRFQQDMISTITMAGRALLDTGPSANDDEVAIVLNIQKQDTWVTDIPRGSWTRILSNILGNSLKYTKTGVISVTLNVQKNARGTATVELVIQDTGIGMTENFLATDLFTPYKQADHHAIGTGLGLSIVKQISRDLSGRLDVQSTLGRGTRTSLILDIDIVEPNADDIDRTDSQLLELAATQISRPFHMLSINDDSTHRSRLGRNATSQSVSNMASEWLKCSVSSGPTLEGHAETGVCAIVETDLVHLAKTDPKSLATMTSELAARDAQLIVLGCSLQSTLSGLSLEEYAVQPTFVQQPIGPRKLMRVLSTNDSSMGAYTYSSLLYATTPDLPTPLVVRRNGETSGQDDAFPWNSDGRGRAPSDHGPAASTVAIRNRPGSAIARKQRQSSSTAAAVQSRSDSDTDQDGRAEGAIASGSTVLLVEDNPINMRLLKVLMQKLQFPYFTADNGAEALAIFVADPGKIFLILTDISMPVMDGNEATAKIREVERRQKLPRTTIVAITGVTSAASRNASIAAGVDRYFTKPVKMEEVSALLSEIRPSKV
ncbi:hypothetical protein LTR86_003205 [Recurvomyces mirabilis]|nr:hypothetical protein LTR86_003205 [Recurvomyces mirabilis]